MAATPDPVVIVGAGQAGAWVAATLRAEAPGVVQDAALVLSSRRIAVEREPPTLNASPTPTLTSRF